MTGKQISRITIVGGGTAGWLTAAYLNHRLQWGLTRREGVCITLVESPNVATVGVGEATVPTLKGTLRILEIPEAEFIARTDASLKVGIRFEGWQRGREGQPVSYVHPFSGGSVVRGRNPGYAFLKYGLGGGGGGAAAEPAEFIPLISSAPAAIDAGKGPRAVDGDDFTFDLQYAYHLDAGLMADFFREVCVERGVEHLRDDVTGVERDERGHIAALQLERGGRHEVELVIDCSGFRGLLINQELGEPFDSYADYLMNDRAIPIQARRVDPAFLPAATTSTALAAGWAWRTPLYSRDGNGYVFCSKFASDDEALAQLEEHLGGAEQITDPRVMPMRVGRTRRSWVGNCVAVGLSGGFIEPLESTGIMSIELAARTLLQYFPTTGFEPALQAQYNRQMQDFYEEVRDFLGLHFTLGNRDDTPYWRAAHHDLKRSDRLTEWLDLWQHRLPSRAELGTNTVFNEWSVQCLLFAKGFYDGRSLESMELVPQDLWKWWVADRKALRRGSVAALPDHLELLDAVRARGAKVKRSTEPQGAQFALPEDHLALFATQIMSGPPRTSAQESRRVLAENA